MRISHLARARVAVIVQLIAERHGDPRFSLQRAAAEVHLSGPYLSRLIKEGTGINFVRHVRAARIRSARELLETTTMSVKEIAAAVGYSHSNHLERNFKAECGVTPKAYRVSMIVISVGEVPDMLLAKVVDQSQ